MKPEDWTIDNLEKPDWFIENVFRNDYGLWAKQREIALSVRDNKYTAVRSCHDSGKSFVSSRIGLWFLLTNENSVVVTTAPSWTQVKEILWREVASAWRSVKDVNEKFDFEAELTTTKLDISPDWFAIGVATKKEGEASQVAERMLGYHAKSGKILVIVDEASGLRVEIWGAIEGLMTSEGARLLAIGNPYRLTGGFADLFKQKGVNRIHIKDTDIPNIREGRIIVPGLMSPEYPKEMEEKYTKDSDVYRVKVKGEFPRQEKDSLVSLQYIEDAFKREITKFKGKKRLGVDVARFGDNETVFTFRQGYKVHWVKKFQKEDTMVTTGRTLRFMKEEGIEAQNVDVDDIGVGGGVTDRLWEQKVEVNRVNVGSPAENDEEFANLRAEAYWEVRRWMKKADLPKEDDYLQLANIKYKFGSRRKGQTQIESKADMKKRGVKSPDVPDSLMLTFTFTEIARFPEQDEGEAKNTDSKPITSGMMNKNF